VAAVVLGVLDGAVAVEPVDIGLLYLESPPVGAILLKAIYLSVMEMS
jgi:hypothetical protein